MTGCKALLTDYYSCDGPIVRFGGESSGKTVGYGKMITEKVTINKVAYVQGLTYNLLSVTQLCDSKHAVVFRDTHGSIFYYDIKKELLRAKRSGDIYVMDFNSADPTQENCFYSKTASDLNWVWHKKLSHLNFKAISNLSRKELVRGLPKIDFSKDKLCAACEKGKRTRSSFKLKHMFSITVPFHLLHMDLFGPVSSPGLRGEKYALVIVDEYTRYTWVFMLRAKSETAGEIIAFINEMDRLNGNVVKQLRSDHGTEFRNRALVDYCRDKGISQNFSAVMTPEQNGVAERRNRTLIEASRTMLVGSGLGKGFWPEAVRTACYTQNRTTIVKRLNKTLYELLTKRKPKVSYFQIFGFHVLF